MADEKSKRYSDWDAAIEKLIALTEHDEIDWEPWDEFRGRGEDAAVPPAFRTEVNGRNVAIYEYRFKYYTDSDEWEYHTDIAIEFIDPSGRLEYAWQGSPYARRRLLDAIRYRAAHVDDFLKEFLSS
jgi:hypothetical protein